MNLFKKKNFGQCIWQKYFLIIIFFSSYHFKFCRVKKPGKDTSISALHAGEQHPQYMLVTNNAGMFCFCLFFYTGKPLIKFVLKKFMSQKQKGTQGIRTIRGIKLLSLYKNSILWFGLQHVGRHMSLHSFFYMYLSCLRVCDKYPCLTIPCQNTLSNLLPFQLWLFCHNIQIISLPNLLSIQL